MSRILLAILVWLAAAPAVLAHAVLVESLPAADAVLAEAPGEVLLRFNEPVAPVSVRLLDAAGGVVAADAVARDAAVLLPLPPLGDGSYLLTWRVVSTDSHPVGGAFRFAVGDAAVPAALPALHDADWRVVSALHRAAWLALLLLGAGGAAFLAAFPAPMRGIPGALRGTRMLLVGAALLALCLLPVQGALILGGTAGPIRDLLAAGAVSPVSLAGLLGAALLLVAAILLARAPAAAAIAAIAAGATLGLSGHAATADPRWLAAPALALHAVLAGLWAGALLPLRAAVGRLPPEAGATLLEAFSCKAVTLVVLLVAAGGVLTVIQVGGPAGFATAYGAVLALKLAGVAVLLGIAFRNRNRLTPRLRAGRPDAARRLRRSIGLEIAVMLAVVACVAALGHLPPPRALAAAGHGHHEHNGAHDATTRLDVEAEGFRLRARIAAVVGGGHAITARFADSDGDPVEPLEVEIAFSQPERGIEPIVRPLPREGDAYRLSTTDMSLPGVWRIEVTALVTAFERVRFAAEAVVAP